MHCTHVMHQTWGQKQHAATSLASEPAPHRRLQVQPTCHVVQQHTTDYNIVSPHTKACIYAGPTWGKHPTRAHFGTKV
jgi:hypothetical protein